MLKATYSFAVLLSVSSLFAVSQANSRPPNASGEYLAIRQSLPTGSVLSVEEFELKRDAGLFHFTQGTVTLIPAINGRETGAVFEGTGYFEIKPEDASERRNLQTVLKTQNLHVDFSTLDMRFTDQTAAELRRIGTPNPSAVANALQAGQLEQKIFRTKLHYNLDERLLEDVLGGGGGFFTGMFKAGGMLGKQYVFMLDPNGAEPAAPDQVALLSSASGDDYDVTLAFALKDAGTTIRGSAFQISAESIDTTLAKDGRLTGKAEVKVTSLTDGLRVLPLQLYSTLRASGVSDSAGNPLDYIQEGKLEDPDFAVILQRPLKAGQSVTIVCSYEGKDVLMNEGNGNYYPVGRSSWYPSAGDDLGTYVNYKMTFRVPKGLQVVATGDKVSETQAGGQNISVWETKEPLAVAGFSLGAFKSKEVTLPDKSVKLAAYANIELPDSFQATKSYGILGALNSTGMLDVALSEGSASLQIYNDYFGPLQYNHLALTQQSACTYGQSWPMMVYLPICYFFDSTYQHVFGLDEGDPGYWKEVVPHEVSHQWWGQTVGFRSYRDQWMSEGFAQWSAGLYLMRTRKSLADYHDFWKTQQRRIVEKRASGKRAIDVGPITMGYRLNSSKAGDDVYERLIYGKGGYVVHMLEILFYNAERNPQTFKATMQDFVRTYSNKAASTEDFKAVVEKHMPRYMDLDHNGKLDWFFDEWVYGTEIPHYVVESNVIAGTDANQVHFKVTQSGVSPTFQMPAALYISSKDGQSYFLGVVTLKGDTTFEKTINLPKQIQNPQKVALNDYEDILSD